MPDSRISYLLDRFYSNTLSFVEHEELIQLLAHPVNREIADEFLLQTWNKFTSGDTFFSTEYTDKTLKSIIGEKESLIQADRNQVMRISWVKIMVAAIFLLIPTFCLHLFFYQNSRAVLTGSVKNSTPSFDAKPGSNVAILTLANHQEIQLHDAKNGVIATDHNISMEKITDGKLSFKKVQNATSARGGQRNELNTLSVPIGGQYFVELSDGTKVWLNAASSLKFPTSFDRNTRTVELIGEAYFEVAKNREKPFHVMTRDGDVQVLGTHFNINAYPDEQVNKTTLLEGSVKVSNNDKSYLMKVGEQATLHTENTKIDVAKIDTEGAVAWKNGYLAFADESIYEVMKKLSRWYGVEVEFESADINETFGGTISKYKNISEVLKVLSATQTIHFKIIPVGEKGRRVIVMK